jgi:hypothetical protein
MRLIHRTPFVEAKSLFVFTREDPLGNYVKRYIKKRLKNMYATDLGSSMFLDDVFFWDNYRRESGVTVIPPSDAVFLSIPSPSLTRSYV